MGLICWYEGDWGRERRMGRRAVLYPSAASRHAVPSVRKESSREPCLRLSCPCESWEESFRPATRSLRAHLWGCFIRRKELQQPVRQQAKLQNLGKDRHVPEIWPGQGLIFLHCIKVSSTAKP